MLKRKQFNIANLGSWAKSIAHSGGKENVRTLIIYKEFTELTEWDSDRKFH
jgi:hypothetical protein